MSGEAQRPTAVAVGRRQRVCVIDGRSKVGQQPFYNLLEGAAWPHRQQTGSRSRLAPRAGLRVCNLRFQAVHQPEACVTDSGAWLKTSIDGLHCPDQPKKNQLSSHLGSMLRQQAICPNIERSGDRWGRKLRAHNCRIAK